MGYLSKFSTAEKKAAWGEWEKAREHNSICFTEEGEKLRDKVE